MAHSEQIDVIELFTESLRELKGKNMFDHVNRDTHIADLGIDSISFVELIGILEDKLDIRLADEEVTRIRTVGDLERTISAKRRTS